MRRILLTAALALVSVAGYAQWSNPIDDIPAYHSAAPAKGEKLPPILAGKDLTGPNFRYAWQTEVYHEAARIPNVLYQLPCFCRCDRALGHTSLHSCFSSLHGAECSTCAQEGAYAYKMTKLGKTPDEIRHGIEHGDYRQIELEKLGKS